MPYKLSRSTLSTHFNTSHSPLKCSAVISATTVQMFVDSVDVINSRVENINLNAQRNMHPKSDRPPTCPKAQVPHLNITLSSANQRRSDGSPQQGNENPWLLKPQHEIPPTPPPQLEERTGDVFTKRAG